MTSTLTLNGDGFYDTAAFAPPPQVAPMDAVRKLAAKLTKVAGIGELAALTIAESVTAPAAVRAALDEPLPGLTAHKDAHVQVIPARVWTPWVTPPADDIIRNRHKKRYPVADPSVPPTPQAKETRDGLAVVWKSKEDRDWHMADNEDLYDQGDMYDGRVRLFPEKGGVVVPLVLVPQTEFFGEAGDPLSLLRIEDGRRRFYEVQRALRKFADWPADSLARLLGDGITPELFGRALQRDRAALTKIINAVRDACTAPESGDVDGDDRLLRSAQYLATCLSLPAYIAVGSVDTRTSEVIPMGSDNAYPMGVQYTLDGGMRQWHSGHPARVVVTGQHTYNGLQLPEARVDTDLIDTAARRLRARGVPKTVVEFGTDTGETRHAARFVWWCRTVRALGGPPATAVAAFARHTEGPWPQAVSRSLLACAAHLMEEDIEAVYPPGDYRDPETRPDSLSLLVSDARNLDAVAGLTDDARGGVLAHPRFRNAAHIALAHLALTGALPAQEPLPHRITSHIHLLSHVARMWAHGQTPVFVRALDGGTHVDDAGRTVIIDERTLNRDDLPWPRSDTKVNYLLPPATEHPYAASHVFKLRHDVIYTIPDRPLDESTIEPTPEALAAVVRRWFPDATGIVMTDWSDKFITGLMVGSVFVRLYDRRGERHDARERGVWYPEGRPLEAKDVLNFDDLDASAPTGKLVGVHDFLTDGIDDAVWMCDVDDTMLTYELDNDIISDVDEALETQKAADQSGANGPDRKALASNFDVPVLRLPELKGARNR